MRVGVEEVHTRRTQSTGNFDNDEGEEGEEDSSTSLDLEQGLEHGAG